MGDRSQVIGAIDDPLCPQEACHEIEIMSRTAHGDGCRLSFDADLEGNFGRYAIRSKVGIQSSFGEALKLYCFGFGICGQWRPGRG